MARTAPLRLVSALCAALLGAAAAPAPAPAAPPEEGECPTVSASPQEQQDGVDATPVALKEGMLLDQQALLVLARLLPPEIWRYREAFFFEGMRMRVGSCHRRYPDPAPYREATERHRGEPRLDGDGNLEDYRAGIPFPPEEIDPEADDAALRWAWNSQMRWRGAGHRGSFRVVDMPSGLGSSLTYEGDFFLVQTAHRADLAASDYRLPDSENRLFAAGGRFTSPFDARHLAWRQFRPAKVEERFQEPDDTFVYVPTMRKTRRAASSWVDGLFFPRYAASGDSGGGGMAFGGGQLGGPVGAINPTAGRSIAVSEHVRRGLVGLVLRPNAYVWRLVGERDVLAPINVQRPGWPEDAERNYGPSGLSLANDSWDVRRAVVIEGRLKVRGQDVSTVTVYVDWQTRAPLYWITRTGRRRFLEVGILAHRWTADVAAYPDWPGGVPAQVLEPVASSFFNALENAGGWRRESWDMRSVPFSEDERRRMLSTDHLARGR